MITGKTKERMEDEMNLNSTSIVNILLMDAMGALTDTINKLPVRLMLNFPATTEDEEVFYTISLFNPDNRLTSKITGFLDVWEKDFAPLLPIRDIFGKWKLIIELSGSINKTENYSLILK